MKLELDCRRRREDFSLDLQLHSDLSGAVGLFGPSGSGKTTLLRVLAGLDRADSGRVAWGGTVWQDSERRLFVAPQRRRVGLVFQDSRLFAHLDVQGNLDYPRRRCHGPIAYADVLAALDLTPLLRRRPQSLSGGERQRVAIGRALLAQPALLLLDEPLSALDAARKDEILPYLQGLPVRFDVPLLYVSHDLREIAALASRVLLLEGGRLRGEADAAQLLRRLAQRREAGVELLAQRAADPSEAAFRVAGQPLVLGERDLGERGECGPAPQLRLRVAARDVLLSLQPCGPGSQVLSLPVHFEAWESEDADRMLARLRLDDGQGLLAELCPSVGRALDLQPGQALQALLRRVDVLP